MIHESKSELLRELQAIETWESEQKDLWFWEKWGRLPFVWLDKLTPAFIQEKIGVALNELGGFIQTGGQYLIQEQDILHKVLSKAEIDADKREPLSIVRGLPLRLMDETAKELMESRVKLATIQGATTGIGGIFTLAIDIPLLLGISLKVLQEIALCYGYDPKDKAERVFIVKSLQFSSADYVGKQAVLEELSDFPQNSQTMISQLQGWREVVTAYRDNFGWKKLFQMIPIAGMLFGAFLNRSTLTGVAETGMMLYRKRRILQRLQTTEDEKTWQ
ncbi:EcsC family protein [Brevibacillus fulvus]|uniref:EcsC family protein n=1 Tax=Brevibacillus fulvus TaxID=1125967 RepID=A0A938XXG4_9BACL|nr:EcsC family protein [Brevibacillus fulvus]MBM7591997.1 hypothetical protein [Brevibacillus fulvus]